MMNGKRERNRNSHSWFYIGFLKTIEIKLRSAAISSFDVQRWTFDVGRSSFNKHSKDHLNP